MNPKRQLLIFLAVLSAIVIIFFRPVIFNGWGYFYGDYKQQFYPWALVLARSLKSFSLPLWAPEIGCGFPLLAEGQSAALYPLNWLLFFLAPFPFSYHAGFAVLFILTGFFTYLFLRECGLSAVSAGFGSGVFLFSSAYAGLFYGLMALRVLAWFPLSLYWLEKLVRAPKIRTAVFLAMTWAMGFLGGYPQMAVYALMAGGFYAILKSLSTDTRRMRFLGCFVCALFLAVGLAAAQLLPTIELASQSGRAGANLDFALQKSFIPLNLATLFWPCFGSFMGFDFYIGLAPFVLALSTLVVLRQDRRIFIFWSLSLLFALLAFGRFNPLYVIFLKSIGFYLFRVPSKFIYFSCFFLSALSAAGLESLLKGSSTPYLKALRNSFFTAVGVFLAAWSAARFFRPLFSDWGRNFVKTAVFGKAGHPHTEAAYFDKVENLLNLARVRTDLLDPHVLTTLGIWTLLILAGLALKRGFSNKRRWALILIPVAFFDLYLNAFISTGFHGNQRPPAEVAGDTLTNYLGRQKGLFRTYEASVGDLENGAPRWLPNSNILFGYSSVGIYTPLVKRDYGEFLSGLGAVDDAMGVPVTSRDTIQENLKRLGFMNVRYVVSRVSLGGIEGLEPVFSIEGGDSIYFNRHFMPRAFWAELSVSSLNNNTFNLYREDLMPDEEGIHWLRYSEQAIELETEASRERMLFLSESYDPGWKATIDGKPAKIYPVDKIFRGLIVPAGKHGIRFFYDPSSFKRGAMLSALSLLACSFLLVGFRKVKKGTIG